MSRFFVPGENIDTEKKEVLIRGEEAHHVVNVMRMGEGDNAVFFDGEGNEYCGRIESVDIRAKTVKISIIGPGRKVSEKSPEIHLVQAIPKGGKMDYIVEKATELGVRGIIPAVTDRTIVRPDRRSSAGKVLRWKKIATQAAKQCGRSDVPFIRELMVYDDIIERAGDYETVLMACLNEDTVDMKKALKGISAGRIMVLIGPEGDFTPREVKKAKNNGGITVSLGKSVLKSDTAGLFALSVLTYELSGR